uniref:MAC/perforin domain-containing protein n=1 Tax=Pedobacter schmidteae TaxID=2201271 RepID=UPI000EAFE245|nr:MAC/perforin domain-containing protein [Pedobacter schmidteae]
MKKNLKFACLVVGVTALMTSCKKKEPIDSSMKVQSMVNSKASAGDGKWDRLGYGVDVTKDLLGQNTVSDVGIFDLVQFEQDYAPDRYLSKSTTTSGSHEFYAGASALDYVKDVNTKKRFAFGADLTLPIDSTKFNFSGSIEKNTSDQNAYTYSTKFSYATYESILRTKRVYFTGDASMSLLMQYLTPDFINNVANQSAEYLVQRYGTHVMMDITIGGCLRFNHSTASVSEANSTSKTKTVKGGLKFIVTKILGINYDQETTQTEINKAMTETRNRQFTLKFFGGTTTGRTVNFDQAGNTSETINIGAWEQSVSQNNAALLEVNKAVFLYEFITDPVKKQQVKAAIENHITNSQIKLSPQEVYEFATPLFNGKHANSLDQNMHIVFAGGGWHPNGQPFKAYSIPHNGAIPIYQFGNASNNDRYLTPHSNFNVPNYTKAGIIFYAYAYQAPGTIPIYQFYLAQGGPDHFYHPDVNIIAPFAGWQFDGIAFYAFPN